MIRAVFPVPLVSSLSTWAAASSMLYVCTWRFFSVVGLAVFLSRICEESYSLQRFLWFSKHSLLIFRKPLRSDSVTVLCVLV